MISTRFSPSSPVGRQHHQPNEEHAEDDVPRRLRLRDHHVLPHECGEVEHGDQQREPSPAVHSVKTSASETSETYDTGVTHVGGAERDDHPVRREVRNAAALAAAAVDPPVVDRARDRMDDDPEDERPPSDDGQPDREAERGEQAQQDDGVEQDARVARIAEQLEQNADQHRAEHDARPGCRRRRG